MVQRNFQLNKQDMFLKNFVEDAILKIVNPLRDNIKSTDKKKLDKDEWWFNIDLQIKSLSTYKKGFYL